MRSFFVALAVATLAGPAVNPASEQVYPIYPPPQTTYPPPQTTPVPGQMTQARVWIENRGSAEAVPVDLRIANMESPLRVEVVNGELAASPPNPALVRLDRQQWDYMTVTVDGGGHASAALNERGTEGWETTGIAWTTGHRTTLLLKRPRG